MAKLSLFIASDSKISSANPIAGSNNGEWKSARAVGSLLKGCWNVITATVSSSSTGDRVALEFQTNGAFTAYLDSVTW